MLVVSGGDGAQLAAAGGLERDGCAAFHLRQTANGRGVADAWAAAADAEAENPEPIGLLIVSGDEAAANPNVRAMAELAEKVIAIGMFRRLVAPWADLILPGTSYLERDGTYVNLEGRLQRIRRAAIHRRPTKSLFSRASLSGSTSSSRHTLLRSSKRSPGSVTAACPMARSASRLSFASVSPRARPLGTRCQTLVMSPRDLAFGS